MVQKTKDLRAYQTLASIAKSKGFESPEEYMDDAIRALPAADRKKYEELRKKVTKTDEVGKMVLFVTGAVATLGLSTGSICELETKTPTPDHSMARWRRLRT